MTMVALPKGKQYGINGPCVNVPANLEPVCTLLPRFPHTVKLVDFKLKCKLSYKGHHMQSKVDPHKIISAINWLVVNNKEYCDVTINPSWDKLCENEQLWTCLKGNEHLPKLEKVSGNQCKGENKQKETITCDKFVECENIKQKKNEEVCEIVDINHDENNCSDDEFLAEQNVTDKQAEVTIQPFSSCVQVEDIHDCVYSLAPGEGNTPRCILMDDNFELHTFPDLFPYGRGNYATHKK